MTTGQSFLENILLSKQEEVNANSKSLPLTALKERINTNTQPRGFLHALRTANHLPIIAEIKRASPSRGVIRADLEPKSTALSYAAGGASCFSVLTDKKFFQGDLQYIPLIRESVPNIPILRKDFIIDSYQVWETRAIGADALLLIVAALSPEQLQSLMSEALALELDVLIEVHTASELEIAVTVMENCFSPSSGANPILGINNRDLHTFKTDISLTKRLLEHLAFMLKDKSSKVFSSTPFVVSESGISSAAEIQQLLNWGATAFLIGESLLATGDPGENLGRLINSAYRK